MTITSAAFAEPPWRYLFLAHWSRWLKKTGQKSGRPLSESSTS